MGPKLSIAKFQNLEEDLSTKVEAVANANDFKIKWHLGVRIVLSMYTTSFCIWLFIPICDLAF